MGRDRLRAGRPGRPTPIAAVLRRLVARPARPGADHARAPGTLARRRRPLSGLRHPVPPRSRRDDPRHRVPARATAGSSTTAASISTRPATRSRRDRTDPGPGFSGWVRKVSFELPYPGPRRLDSRHDAPLRPRRGRDGSSRAAPTSCSDPLSSQRKGRERPVERGPLLRQGPVTRQMTGLTLSTDRDRHPGRREAAHDHPVRSAQGRRPSLHRRAPRPLPLPRVPPGRDPARRDRCQPLLWIDDWNIDWQDQYRFAMPVRLPKGNRRDPGRLLRQLRGQSSQSPTSPRSASATASGSKDEMCACHLEILPDDPGGYEAYPNKSPFGL